MFIIATSLYLQYWKGNANVTGTTPTELGKLGALEYMVLGMHISSEYYDMLVENIE